MKEEATTRSSLLNTYEKDNEELRTNVHELRVKLKHVQSTRSKAASQSSDRLYSRQRKEREYWLETPQYKVKNLCTSNIPISGGVIFVDFTNYFMIIENNMVKMVCMMEFTKLKSAN